MFLFFVSARYSAAKIKKWHIRLTWPNLNQNGGANTKKLVASNRKNTERVANPVNSQANHACNITQA
ncbi:hypothetical protein DLM45_06590 [Hyphomicrobium methylovorum]|nr:hypothetical protein [Hyphomicrobium methylovorum]